MMLPKTKKFDLHGVSGEHCRLTTEVRASKAFPGPSEPGFRLASNKNYHLPLNIIKLQIIKL
jgi:hypothetical protein